MLATSETGGLYLLGYLSLSYAAIQANQAAIIGYMTQEKISGLERENAALTMQLSQNAQTRAIIEALSKTSTTTPAA